MEGRLSGVVGRVLAMGYVLGGEPMPWALVGGDGRSAPGRVGWGICWVLRLVFLGVQ